MGMIRREVKEVIMTPQRPDVGMPANVLAKLSPEWITGFIDGEGCFHVGISKHPEMKSGYQILPELTVVQHERDLQLLHQIRSVMECGVVRRNHGDRYCWRVRNLKNLQEVIIPFFERHVLRSKKGIEFQKFAKVVAMMSKQEHLTDEGFKRIRKIASTMNRGGRDEGGIKIESIPG
jgi:hypothetical protein